MKIRLLAALCAALIFPLASLPARAQLQADLRAETPVYVGPAMVQVEQIKTVWRDQTREREVPVTIFYPRATGPFPLLILSHGLGGSRDTLTYLGRYWAEHGYVCAQIQHPGTDEGVWRGATTEAQAQVAMKRAVGDLTNILNRPRDVSFAIDQMLRLNADAQSELNGKINADEIGVAGHSLGGLTALLSAGQRAIAGGFSADLSDARIKACVAMSSPLNAAAPLADQFADYQAPTFYVVGQNDNVVLGATIAHEQIYNAIRAPDQYLLILAGADHMTFAGARFGPDAPADARDHTLTQTATLAFWQAQFNGNEAAKNWLRNDFKNQLSANSVFESK